MSVADALRHARALVAGGWSEPMSSTSAGAWCSVDDEGVYRYCVADALELGARERCDYLEAETALTQVIVPSWHAREAFELKAAANPTDDQVRAWLNLCRARGAAFSLSAWLQHPRRDLSEVLQGFSLAVLRAKAQQELH